MIKLLRRFRKDRSGATAIEYALVACLISIVIVGAATAIGTRLNAKFQNLATGLN